MSDHLNSYAYASKSNYSPRKTSGPRVFSAYLGIRAMIRRPCCSCHRRQTCSRFFCETHFGRGLIHIFKGDSTCPPLPSRFGGFALAIFFFTYVQSIVQTYASERVARDLRLKLVIQFRDKAIDSLRSEILRNCSQNITSDIDSKKCSWHKRLSPSFLRASIISAAAIILLTIDWKNCARVLTIIPIIGGTSSLSFD